MSAPRYDDNFVAEALPVFISEAREQIESVEQLLLQLEDAPDDRELLDALFRCAHTVKGSAGIFGLDRVVAFTHHVETLLDRLRDGAVALTPALSTLLLRSNDQIRALVDAAQTDAPDSPDQLTEREQLVEQLRLAGGEDLASAAAAPSALSAPSAESARAWRLWVAFGEATFRNGMDPLAIISYLHCLGEVTRIDCDLSAVPTLDVLDPEACHLRFELALDTEATRQDIESAFSFVQDDCELQLLAPGTSEADIARLIAAMPDSLRLGDILVGAGAVSRAQIQAGLQQQGRSAAAGVAKPLGEILQASAGLNPKIIAAALDKQGSARDADPARRAGKGREAVSGEDNRFIRVEAGRLDNVINLLGELVTASAGGLLLARRSMQRELSEANLQISRLVEDIRNGTLQLRMVPIGETFARFRRVVRDTAAELGKDVALDIVGADTELDKSVVERIADPLMHLVRNALDHGLETPEQRLAAGKPAQGRLELSACHESGGILIRISDDGRGVQRDRVLQRAWERGLVAQGVVPADEDILKLIFEPGFSTAEKVTNLSGRGVGMDVVRRNIENLRGKVALTSQPGQGSVIEIRLPLTLAIIDGFLVGVGNSKFIFPLDAVVEVIENRQPVSTLDEQGRGVVELRGQVLPVVGLRTLYALDGAAGARASVVVLRDGPRRFGVQVDVLLGQHQTVIKPLGRLLSSMRGISGSSILGTGEVALIFDVPALAQLAARSAGPPPGLNPAGSPAPAQAQTLDEGQLS